MKIQSLLLFTLIMTSCSLLDTHRSFVDEMDRDHERFFVAGNDFQVIPGDTAKAGYTKDELRARTPLTAKERERTIYEESISRELERKELELSEEDYAFYRRNWDYLQTTYERLYFLNLSRVERINYVQGLRGPSRAIASGDDDLRERVESPIAFYQGRIQEGPAVQSGMTKDDVVETVGRPHRVEVAGNPAAENERWFYKYHNNSFYIYFESGRVHGWARD